MLNIVNKFKAFRSSSLSMKSMHTTGSSADQHEVIFHGHFSSSWWDDDSLIGPLKALNRLRVPFIRDGLINNGVLDKNVVSDQNCLKGLNILDVGCGGGLLCEALAKIGANVVGVEPSEKLVSIARDHSEQNSSISSKIRYENCFIEDFSSANIEQFDVVISSEVIEHVTDKETFLQHCISTLKPNGSLFITTPNQTFLSWFSVILIAENLGWMPKGLHQYEKFIAHDKLESIINSYNCRTKSIQGFTYNPFTKSFDWVPHKLLLYALHAVKNVP